MLHREFYAVPLVRIFGSYYESLWFFIKVEVFDVPSIKLNAVVFPDGKFYDVYVSPKTAMKDNYKIYGMKGIKK